MTIQLVASGSLGSTTSITNIPQDGTDLMLLLHIRGTTIATNTTAYIQLNEVTSAVYTAVRFRGRPTGLDPYNLVNNSAATSFEIPGTGAGSDNYATVRIYFTNYTSNQAKPFTVEQVMSTNTTNNPSNIANGRTSRTAAISSIQIKDQYVSTEGSYSLYKIVTS